MNSRFFQSIFKGLPRRLGAIVLFILFGFVKEIVDFIRKIISARKRRKYLEDNRRGRNLKCAPRCATFPPDIYKRADPLIYCQKYLMEQGLAVTWDNPDIQLFRNGVAVSSSALEAGTEYQIVATIYNNSTEAPAVHLPVEFSFLSFGIGTPKTDIGNTYINLPVKGAAGHPTQASMTWRTPDQEGHYCLQVFLNWPDDANPKNNLGQENTNVGHFSSPAHFNFPLHNDDTIPKLIRLAADTYAIPPLIDCGRKPDPKTTNRELARYRKDDVFVPPLEEAANWNFIRSRHNLAQFPVPAGWTVKIEPAEVFLQPLSTVNIQVQIDHPPGFVGEETFNINALHGRGLIGGVTLTVSTN